jgi:PAS domain S-box-containing protein
MPIFRQLGRYALAIILACGLILSIGTFASLWISNTFPIKASLLWTGGILTAFSVLGLLSLKTSYNIKNLPKTPPLALFYQGKRLYLCIEANTEFASNTPSVPLPQFLNMFDKHTARSVEQHLKTIGDVQNNGTFSLDSRHQASRLNTALEHLSVGVIILNLDMVVEFANRQALQILNLPEDFDASKNKSKKYSLFSHKAVVRACEKSKNSARSETLTLKHEDKHLMIHMIFEDSDIFVEIHDVTLAKIEHEELTLLKVGMDRASDMFVITKASPLEEPGPEIVYVNDTFCKITGYTKSEAIGKNPRFLQGDETSSTTTKQIHTALENGQPITVDIINYSKSGRRYINELSLSPLKRDDGTISHFFGVQRDVTVRREEDEILNQRLRLDSIGVLTGGVAHDFNNLLTIVLGNCELLLQNVYDERETFELTQGIAQAANQGAELTKSLLTFAGKQPSITTVFLVADILKSVKPLLLATFNEEYDLEITNKAPEALIAGDKAKIESIFLNMAVNAKDAMTIGGTFSIGISIIKTDSKLRKKIETQNDEFLHISFSDTGLGIDPKIVNRIFEPFFTTKSKHKGTGLGLSTIYAYVKEAGGHIEVKPHFKEGTCFIIYLPLAKEKISGASNIQAKIQPSSQELDTREKNLKVIVVEDNLMVLAFLKRAMENLGYEAIYFEYAKDALVEVQRNNSYDLMITDFILPEGFNGGKLISEINKIQPNMYFIVISGYVDGRLEQSQLKKDNIAFLQKPFKLAALKRSIFNLMNKR